MASLVKRGGIWYIAWRQNGKQYRKSTGCTKKSDAKDLLEVWHREADRDRVKSAQKNPTLAEFNEKYSAWAASHLKSKTRSSQAQRWKAFADWLKFERLGDVTAQDIERFKLHLLSEGCTKVTVNNYLRDLSAHFGHAIKSLKMFSGPNPCAGVERLRVEQSAPPSLSQEEIERLMEAAKAHSVAMHGFCALGVYAGLRLGEIVNARWEWFDWEGRLLHIPSDEQFSTKSHKGRSIPLHGKLIEILQPHAESEGYLFEARTPTGKRTSGNWLYRWSPKRPFREVITTAKLPDANVHLLRHTFATQLARAGVSIYKIKEWMGHSDVKVTSKYAHVQGYDGDIDRL